MTKEYLLNILEHQGQHRVHIYYDTELDAVAGMLLHKAGEEYPRKENQEYLGYFSDCNGAIQKAKKLHPSWIINGCKVCVPDCHTSILPNIKNVKLF